MDAGLADREVAERMLAQGFKPECPDLTLMFLQPPWWIPLKG